jgi:hypothetical protein
MMSWYAEVTLDATIDDTQAANITAALPYGFATITANDAAGQATVGLIVDAATLRQATDAALKDVTNAARNVLGRATIVGVRVLTEDAYCTEVERPAALDLVGSTEGGELLGISRQRFDELARTRPDFPPGARVVEQHEVPVALALRDRAELAAGQLVRGDAGVVGDQGGRDPDRVTGVVAGGEELGLVADEQQDGDGLTFGHDAASMVAL